MSKPIVDVLASDATKAAYRVAGRQLTKVVKAAVVKTFQKNGAKKTQLNALMSFFDTELGEAALSGMIGVGLNYAPVVKDDERAQALAKEFRINGMSIAGNVVMETLMGELLPTVMNSIQALPDPSRQVKVRVLDEESEEAKRSLKV